MPRDLLFEIGCEEIPARFLPLALREIKKLARSFLEESGLDCSGITTLGTPRRLCLYVSELAEEQPDRFESILGPPKKIAFDDSGRPTKAAQGFARSHGVSVEELKIKETPRGEYLFLERRLPGRKTEQILIELLPRLIREIPFPKSMRWGTVYLRFARPIRWILALFGRKTIPIEIAGLKASNITYGHRFMAPGPIEIESFVDYVRKLREAYVIVDPAERLAITLDEIKDRAQDVGGNILEDRELLEENAHLVEYPYAICGRFDESFLDLPRPVLITAMAEHQRYFAVINAQGKLMARFIAVNNNRPQNPSALIKGHERVLKARLEDARFFFEEDKKIPLERRLEELKGVSFHEALGSLYDKVIRIEALSIHLAERLAPEKMAIIRRAARLSKADLMTEMVQEFPSLQGIMGREYALAEGEPPEVAQAIYEHYLPLRAGGDLPETMPGAIISIADKIDTLCAFFGLGEHPSGTADPYGLRRQALGIINTTLKLRLHFSLKELVEKALLLLAEKINRQEKEVLNEVIDFIGRRFQGELTSRGFRADLVEAILAVSYDDLQDAHDRLVALEAFYRRPEFAALSVGFKRVMNMVKKQGELPAPRVSLLLEPAEQELYQAWTIAYEKVAPLVLERRYEEALAELLKLKEPIDQFFDQVFVMVKEEDIRKNRLALLKAIAKLFLLVADLSKIRED
ncbi:glycine--tRNA ligase subunit beta [Thermosulfuriphilus sp.]